MKVLFVTNLHSTVDVITNSSSELFVTRGNNKEEVERLIKEVYPNYLDEYYPLKSIDELTWEELAEYVFYADKGDILVKEFPDEDVGKEEYGIFFINWDFVKRNVDKIRDILDPNRTMFFLFSMDENPDFDKQEQLETIMTRYHLG